MNFIKHFSTRAKFVVATALALVAVAVPMAAVAELGSDRPTKVYNGAGTAGFDQVTFNSFTNVPNIGDERNFLHAKINGADGGFYDPMNGVRNGDEILVRVYVHNGADPKYNASGQGVAKNTRVRVALPTGMASSQVAKAFVSADNAQPQVIEDSMTVTGETPVGLSYVPGSATIKSNFQDKPLSDSIVSSGVLIGDDNINGTMKGCFEYVALVTFKVKVTAPSYSLDKKVRMNGTPTFTDEVTAKAGDKVDFVLGFKNTGSTELRNVVLGDALPKGFTYVPGTTEWNSGHTSNKWTKVENDTWINGGLNVGAYAPGGAVYLRFTAIVAKEDDLACGVNKLVNTGYAKPADQGTIEDKATVSVTKVCNTPTPAYSCDLLDITSGANRTVTVKDFKASAKDGATFKHVVVSWGDGTPDLTTNTVVGKTHQYAADGTYTVKATAYFTVNGETVSDTSAACSESVSFTTPTTPPTTPETPVTPVAPEELPSVGVGSVVSLFGVTALAGAIMHRLFFARRLASDQ